MDSRAQEPDGGQEFGFDEQALYVVVRKAVEDALLGVIGTLVAVLVGFSLAWFGMAVAASGQSTAAFVGGIVVTGVGLTLAASAVGLGPSIWD